MAVRQFPSLPFPPLPPPTAPPQKTKQQQKTNRKPQQPFEIHLKETGKGL